MNETTHSLSRQGRMPRRIGAVLAGLIVIFVLSVATDVLLHATGVYPPHGEMMSDGQFLLALAYLIVYAIIGCYVAAWLAPWRPMWHAMALGVVGVGISTVGAVAMWEQGPAWFSLAVIAISPPCAWIAGRLREAQLRSAASG